jgi:hypothetical protein
MQRLDFYSINAGKTVKSEALIQGKVQFIYAGLLLRQQKNRLKVQNEKKISRVG